ERSLVGTVVVEEVVQEAGPLGQREELRPESEKAAGRNRELHARPVAVAAQMLELAAPLADRRDHCPGELLAAVDHQLFKRLEHRSVLALPEDHLWPAQGELEALAAHRLGEDREGELAAAQDQERVGVGCPLHAQSYVPLQLFLEPLEKMPAGHVLSR